MRVFKVILPGFLMLVLILSSAGYTQNSKFERKGFKNWPDVEAVNIYDDGAGDFLDINMDIFRKKAISAYSMGQYEAAAKYYMVVVQHNIKDAVSIYNIACCYGLLGEPDQAAKFLIRAVRAGYEDIDFIKQDKDFDNVKGNPDFDNTIDELEKRLSWKKASHGAVNYYNSPTLMKCRIYLPENFDPEKSYPLVVGLHGYSGTPDQFVQYGARFTDTDVIFAAPQAPYGVWTSTGLGYSWSLLSKDTQTMSDSGGLSIEYIIDTVNSLKSEYKIDKTYLMGFSQGCIMTYIVGIKNHDLFDGLICFGGWLEKSFISEDEFDAARDLKVFIAHGRMDDVNTNGGGKGAYEFLKEKGYDTKFFEFNAGHIVPDIGIQVAEEWLFKASPGED